MAQSFTAIQQALETQLLTVNGISNTGSSANYIGENAGIDLTTVPNPTGKIWVRTTLIPTMTTVATLGTGGFVKPGGFFAVDMAGPLTRGYTSVKQLADLVIAAFIPGQMLTMSTGDKVVIEVASPSPNITQGGWAAGAYYWNQVLVKWWAYVTP